MRIALGCDHRGLRLKQAIMKHLQEMGHEYHDFGTYEATAADYPDYARLVAEGVASGRFDRGILICSTGVGMCMAANKVKGIRAALCHDTFSAWGSRAHTDANILCLGESVIGEGLALEVVRLFLTTDFEGGRHARRLEKMRALE